MAKRIDGASQWFRRARGALALLLFTAATACAGSEPKVRFETIDRGFYSHYKRPASQTILELRDASAWRSFWKSHTAGRSPAPPLPDIDFREYFVVVALDEIRRSGGYSIAIKQIELDPAAGNRVFSVTLETKVPGSAAATSSAITRPYHIVKVKR